jgi:TRAP-type C4-dicarboxylate transport system permease large subunit
LLFVGRGIAGCKYDETIGYCCPFIAALVFVMLLVAFVPITATYIPHRFLGP